MCRSAPKFDFLVLSQESWKRGVKGAAKWGEGGLEVGAAASRMEREELFLSRPGIRPRSSGFCLAAMSGSIKCFPNFQQRIGFALPLISPDTDKEWRRKAGRKEARARMREEDDGPAHETLLTRASTVGRVVSSDILSLRAPVAAAGFGGGTSVWPGRRGEWDPATRAYQSNIAQAAKAEGLAWPSNGATRRKRTL